MAYYLVNGFWWLFSLLPLKLLYVLSDCIYYLLYYCIRYRRKVVRKNLVNSFPQKTEKEIIKIEKGFYAWFCDYVVETIKVRSFSEEEMQRRMTFEGLEAFAGHSDMGYQKFTGKGATVITGYSTFSSRASHYGGGCDFFGSPY